MPFFMVSMVASNIFGKPMPAKPQATACGLANRVYSGLGRLSGGSFPPLFAIELCLSPLLLEGLFPENKPGSVVQLPA